MDNREITLWVDSRWCDALESSKGKTMDALMQEQVDALIQTLPQDVRDLITAEIRQEDKRRTEEKERSRRFSVSRVTECGKTHIYLSENGDTPFQMAKCLRRYLRGEDEGRGLCPDGAPLTEAEMERYVAEAVSGSERVVGVYDIDLDGGKFSKLDPKEGWQTFLVRDISSAIYFATKDQMSSWTNKHKKFYAGLDGKQMPTGPKPVFIRGVEPLPVDKISFEEEVSQDGNLLEFFAPVDFGADAVFGTNIGTGENDEWVNLYANYDMERGCVCDTLVVYHMRGDGSTPYQYRLTPEECAALFPRMDAYCKDRMGLSLEEARAQYLSEGTLPQEEPAQTPSQPSAPTTQM